MSCVHERALNGQHKDSLVGMVIAMKGGPCTGKTTLARALAKSLRCTLASQDDFLSCISKDMLLPTKHLNDISSEVLWRVAETQLHRRHSVIIDSLLHTGVNLDRLRALSSSGNEIMPIIIECRAQDKSEWSRRLSNKTYSPEVMTERINLEEDADDTGDIPKLTIDTTSQLEIEEHLKNMESFILSCLDKKLYGDISVGESGSGCSNCIRDYVDKLIAHLPTTLKHQCHEYELKLVDCGHFYAVGKKYQFHCNGCGGTGTNLYYSCFGHCRLHLHAKCALKLPVTVTPSFHWHPLVLTSRPDRPDRWYCDYHLCEKKRRPDDWVYFCEECHYYVHVKCANPEFYEFPELVELI